MSFGKACSLRAHLRERTPLSPPWLSKKRVFWRELFTENFFFLVGNLGKLKSFFCRKIENRKIGKKPTDQIERSRGVSVPEGGRREEEGARGASGKDVLVGWRGDNGGLHCGDPFLRADLVDPHLQEVQLQEPRGLYHKVGGRGRRERTKPTNDDGA